MTARKNFLPRMPLVTVTAISIARARVMMPPTNQMISILLMEVRKLALLKIFR